MSETLLQIQGLTVSFKIEKETIHAVNEIFIDIHKKETVGIVGESGSGKSVTSLALMGLIPQPPGKISSGKALFNDKGAWKNLLKKRMVKSYRGKRIAMIFQEPMTSLNPVHTCGRQVMEMLLTHEHVSRKKAHSKTLELFKEVQLPRPEKLMRSYPHQLSGGQRQRVMIAMAIACKPDLLIADEPTTALDVTVQKSILLLLHSLQKKYGMSMLFISHDLGVIAQIASRVVVMYRGEIVEEGYVSDIFRSPKHPYTKGLLACRPTLKNRAIKLPTVADFMKNPGKEPDIHYEIPAQRSERLKLLYTNEPLIRIKNLNVSFPLEKNIFGKTVKSLEAVKNVCLDIFKGETLGLVGESGCGKTTLGRTLLRLCPAASGSIIYKNNNVLSMSKREMKSFRKDAQIIFQDPYSSLNPRFTIGAAILEVMNVHCIGSSKKERKEKINKLLSKVGLDETYYNRYPHNLSGGQRQRVCIARALALNPDFLICDESVSALDVSIQAQVLNLLNDLKKEFDLTFLFISHDLSVVKFISDRIAVMNAGEIIELEEADELYSNPQKEYTQKLIAAIPL